MTPLPVHHHPLSGRRLAIAAGAGSAALLAGALVFQALGYAPCELCLLQRWPHVAAALIGGAIWLVTDRPALRWLGVLAAAVATVLAVYHTGVEAGWWAGPSACSGGVGDIARLSTQDLMARLSAAPVVRCDEPALRVFGVTMANANAAASAALTAIWWAAARRRV